MADSPLFVKSYDLLKYLIPATEKFPKSQRFVLAKRIQDAALALHECLLEARKVDLVPRREVLRRADVELEKLRLHLRLSMELGILKFPQYEAACGYVVEIGRMLGAWRGRTEERIAQAVPAGSPPSCGAGAQGAAGGLVEQRSEQRPLRQSQQEAP